MDYYDDCNIVSIKKKEELFYYFGSFASKNRTDFLLAGEIFACKQK